MNNILTDRFEFSTHKQLVCLDGFYPDRVEPATFSLLVRNQSETYASFYLKLKAAGAQDTRDQTWYQISPGQSYSIGPNDYVEFNAKILALPPGREDFIGTLSLQAQIFSPELTHPERPKEVPLTLYVIGKPAPEVIQQEHSSLGLSSPGPLVTVAAPVICRLWVFGLAVMGIAALISALFPSRDHRATVNYVQFFKGSTHLNRTHLISGAEDGRLMGHPVGFWPWWHRRVFYESSHIVQNRRSIEVVQGNETHLFVGFKNGDIAQYDLDENIINKNDSPDEVTAFYNSDSSEITQKCGEQESVTFQGDRVYDLTLDDTGENLYSAHGSGRVLQWDVKNHLLKNCLQATPNATAAAMTFATINGLNYLVVAGQYNHLVLFLIPDTDAAPDTNSTFVRTSIPPISSESISKDNHIRSIAPVSGNPSLVVTGDDQGNITQWDLEACLNAGQVDVLLRACKHSWVGHSGQPIRSVASVDLNEDASCLVSGGDDGQVKLWPLTWGDNARLPLKDDGTVIVRKSRQWLSFRPFKVKTIETVNLIQAPGSSKLWIASGREDGKVRIQKRRYFIQKKRYLDDLTDDLTVDCSVSIFEHIGNRLISLADEFISQEDK